MFQELKTQPFGSFYQIRCCLPFLIIAVFCYFFMDIPVTLYFNDLLHQGHGLSHFLSLSGIFIHTVFNGKYLFPIMLLVLLLLTPKHQNQKVFKILLLTFLSLIFLNLILGIMKHIMGRARPMLMIEKGIYGFQFFKNSDDYFSFPSGHTFNITIVCLILSVFYPQRKLSLCSLGILFIATRVWFIKHYCSDVLMSIYLVLILLPFNFWIFQKLAQFRIFKFIQPSLDLLIQQWNRKSS